MFFRSINNISVYFFVPQIFSIYNNKPIIYVFHHPKWLEPYEWLGKIDKYPLHLISNQPTHRLHSQLDNAITSQNEKIGGREPVLINPIDAEKRKIKSGDIVNLTNDRGSLLAGAKITDDVMPGVVVLSTGAWFDPDENTGLDFMEIRMY